MNGAVDFSNPYCVLQTNSEHEGHGAVGLEPAETHFSIRLVPDTSVELYYWTRQQSCLRSHRDARAIAQGPIFSFPDIEYGGYMALPRLRLADALGRS